ncbi:MAG: hypothetical protein HUJ29_09130 [Gammaproteobacteria bacterium]|nr:hypothetical protein [Gammaproteobacteria bacterium]
MDPLLKHREISFSALHPDPDQAQSAMLLLDDLDGVEGIHLLHSQRLQISYRLDRITLDMIEEALRELGFHLDNSLMAKLKRALVSYSEETQRTNLGCDQGNSQCTRKVFIRHYSSQNHGCRDERPHHWRIYR